MQLKRILTEILLLLLAMVDRKLYLDVRQVKNGARIIRRLTPMTKEELNAVRDRKNLRDFQPAMPEPIGNDITVTLT